jgi:hypothetical protein
MPKLKIDKKSLEGPQKVPNGVYTVRLDGFEPNFTKEKKEGNYNLNPVMKIINNNDLHDRRIFDNVNSNAGWIERDFCHCFGIKLENPDDPDFPGEFTVPPGGDSKDPTQWKYQGPLLGQTGRLEVAEVTGNNGKVYSNVKRYLCRVPGCTESHSQNLIG